MGILNRHKRFLLIQTKVLIYNSLVLSHLNFGILLWGFKCENQELKFYYKYKNNKLPHYLQSLPFHPNTRTHDHDTHIKHKIHNPIGKHVFTKSCVLVDIPRIVNNCQNSILDKINTHSLHRFSGYIKTNYLQCYQENCTIMDCYVMYARIN